MNWRTSCWKAKSSGLNSMSITNLPLGMGALIMGAHLYVNGKLRLATFLETMIAPKIPACPACGDVACGPGGGQEESKAACRGLDHCDRGGTGAVDLAGQ